MSKGEETMAMPLTQALGMAVSGMRAKPLDADVAQRAWLAFVDTLGVMCVGSGEAAPVVVSRAQGLLYGDLEKRPAPVLATYLGIAAHALDYDDVAFGGHPSAVIVPAVLAAAKLPGVNRSSDWLAAYVAGYETWGEISRREPVKYHARGLHPTGMLGPMAAAAAAACLLKLDGTQCTQALSLAASCSAGLVANFGSMTKPYHAGRAACAGVEAAWMVSQGLSASKDALEADAGFLKSYSSSGGCDLRAGLDSFGLPRFLLATDRPSVKRYPVCYAAHRCVDAALQLRDVLSAVPNAGDMGHVMGDVFSIEACLSERNSSILRFHAPSDVSQVRFSLEYCVAIAWVHGRLGLKELGPWILEDERVRTIAGKVRRKIETEMDPSIEGFAVADRVCMIGNGGHRYDSEPVRRAKGHCDRPLSVSEIFEKFDDCLAASGIELRRAGQIADGVRGEWTRASDMNAWLTVLLRGMTENREAKR